VEFHPETHTWEAKATLLDDPPNEAYIVIAKIGKTEESLHDYYTEVGQITNHWIGLRKFNSDTKIYDRVRVRNGFKSG
jgi:hypothetical protein